MTEQPTLSLVSGDETFDLEALRKMYVSLTGEEPSEEEIEKVKARLQEAKQQGH